LPATITVGIITTPRQSILILIDASLSPSLSRHSDDEEQAIIRPARNEQCVAGPHHLGDAVPLVVEPPFG
jgi:hypothetical protein